jgi:hypothetical protein
MKVDLHVATQGAENSDLERVFVRLGLRPDELLQRHVTFLGDTPISACPLIGLHMTKKYDALPFKQARADWRMDMRAVREALLKSGETGYAHLEMTLPDCDATIKSNKPLSITRPWPIMKFKPVSSENNKQWDIHVAVPVDNLDHRLESVLNESGMYFIELWKIRENQRRRFRIFTIQGLSSPIEGRRLFDAMCNWFQDVGAAHVEIKQETYIDMIRVGNPTIVPPTIQNVDYLTPDPVLLRVNSTFPEVIGMTKLTARPRM